MPYIATKEKQALGDGEPARSPGTLNYLITKLLVRYLVVNGESYRTYNDIIGVLECAKLEIYRRKVAAYEDIKKNENGDVY